MKKKIDLGIIILNYKTYKETLTLVYSLIDLKIKVSFQIIVVDNDSPNNSIKELKKIKKIENVSLLKSDSNLGYACGNNLGLNFLYENFICEFVAILNNDVILNDQLIFSKLINSFKVINNCGFIAPVEVDKFGKINSYCGRKRPSFLIEILNSILLFPIIFPNISRYNIDLRKKKIKVDIIAGSFLFTSLKYFKEINFFDEGTFLFLEERILSKKVENSNKGQFLILETNYQHQTSLSINKTFSGLDQAKIYNKSLLYYTRNYTKYGNYKALVLNYFLKFKIFQFTLYYFFKNFLKILKFN